MKTPIGGCDRGQIQYPGGQIAHDLKQYLTRKKIKHVGRLASTLEEGPKTEVHCWENSGMEMETL